MRILLHKFAFIALATIGSCAVVSSANACGMSWAYPKGHFDGVGDAGQVLLHETLGHIDISPKFSFPVFAVFDSNKLTASPFAGVGWSIPLFESSIVQVSENEFLLTQPDGWTRRFYRKNATDSILADRGGWKGIIDGSSITVWSECGWRLTFIKGLLNQMMGPDQKPFTISRNGQKTASLQQGNQLLASISRVDDKTSILQYGESSVKILLSNKPRLTPTATGNLIEGFEQSLSQVVSGDSTTFYNWSVDDKMRPNVLIKTGDTIIKSVTWAPDTHLVSNVDDWVYSIIPPEHNDMSPRFTRTGKNGISESWWRDRNTGTENEIMNGVQKITRFFASGPANGKMREMAVVKNGKEEPIYRASVNENGKLLRDIYYDRGIERSFDDKGRLITVLQNGKELYKFTYAQDSNQLLSEFRGKYAPAFYTPPTKKQ